MVLSMSVPAPVTTYTVQAGTTAATIQGIANTAGVCFTHLARGGLNGETTLFRLLVVQEPKSWPRFEIPPLSDSEGESHREHPPPLHLPEFSSGSDAVGDVLVARTVSVQGLSFQ